MNPDEIFIAVKAAIICFLVICCFCAWLHVKAVAK